MTTPSYWRWKAYDEDLQVRQGLAQASSFHQLAIKLRQTGLQIIGAESISSATYAAEQRLKSMRQRLGIDDPTPTTTNETKIRSWWHQLLCFWK